MTIALETKYLNLASSQLRNFKKKRSLLWNFSCPYCGDSKKDKKKARGYIFEQKEQNGLLYKCWNCGRSTTLPKLIEFVDENLYKEMQRERFRSGEVKRNDKNIQEDSSVGKNLSRLNRFINKSDELKHAQKLSELDSNHICSVYVRNRKIPESQWDRLYFTDDFKHFAARFTEKYDKVLREGDPRLIIPFFNRKNELTMLQARSLGDVDKKFRYITLKFKEDEQKLFGEECLDFNKRIYLVEGPLDSLFLPNAVASADSSLHTIEIDSDDVVRVFDNEPRNKDLVGIMEKSFKAGQQVCIWDEKNNLKDINDMVLSGRESSDIQKEIDSNVFSGLKLRAKISQWRKC